MDELKQAHLITGIKYIYLIFFFAFLSGIFSPIITSVYPDKPLMGMLILFVGLIGPLMFYHAAKNENKRLKYIILGSVITFVDMIFIISATGQFG